MKLCILLLACLSISLRTHGRDEDLDYSFGKAAANGDLGQIKVLLKKGAGIDSKTEGFSALMLAAIQGHTNIVGFLLNAGANVNQQGAQKATALLLAAGQGRAASVKMLLDKGADFRVSDKGLTPLMMAAAGGYTNIIELLIAKGDNVNAKQPDGWTVLMHAAYYDSPATIALLLKSGADTSPKNEDGKTAAEIAEEQHHKGIAEMIRMFKKPPAKKQ